MDEEKELKLSEKFVLKRDKYQMWIEEYMTVKVKSTNTEKLVLRRVTGYYKNFSDLMENFAETKFRTVDAKNAKDLLNQMVKIEAEVKAICKKVKANV